MKLFKNHIERETFYRMSIVIIVFILLLFFLNLMPNFLTPILISIICAYVLMPLVNFLESHKIPRSIGTLIIFSLFAFLVFYILQHSYFKILNQFEGFQSDLPRIVEKQLNNLEDYEKKYSVKYPFIKQFELVSKAKSFVNEFSKSAITSTPKWISSIFSLFIFIPFFSFFFIKDSRRIKKWILNTLPNKYFESGLQVIHETNKSMANYIQGRFLEAGIVGLITYIGLLIIGVKYSLLLGVIAGILNLVPYIGPMVAAIPGLLFAYYYSDTLWTVFFASIVYGFAQLLDSAILIPIIFSRIVNIHPAIVILLVIVGGNLMGILGMIFAVPVYGIIKAVSDAIFLRVVSN